MEALESLMYRVFVLSMLGLAIFYSNQAIEGWKDSPIIVSGIKM